MPNEQNYKLRILYEVSLAKWRIDDQTKKENQEWCLYVYDRNKAEWIPANSCNRDGEYVRVKHIQVVENDE